MYIYNVTVNIDSDVHLDWLEWMKSTHIPDVLKTGCFTGHQMVKVLSNDEGFTYSIQYKFENMGEIDRYQKEFAPMLQREHRERYDGKFAAFRTLLKIID